MREYLVRVGHVAASASIGLFLILATPATADTVYTCEHGSTMTFVEATGEMLIKRPGQMDISIPHEPLCTGGRMSGWSTTPGDGGDSCGKAPYAEDWRPAHGPQKVYYMLDEGKRVDCVEKN